MARVFVVSLVAACVLWGAGPVGGAELGEGAVSTGATDQGTDVVTVKVEDHDSGATVKGVVRITIPGMAPYVMAGNVGNIDWVRNGDAVSGTIRNADGDVVSTINGRIMDGRLGRNFSDASGREGTWEWDGPIPQ